MITLTASAIGQVKKVIGEQAASYAGIRVGVEGGGCVEHCASGARQTNPACSQARAREVTAPPCMLVTPLTSHRDRSRLKSEHW